MCKNPQNRDGKLFSCGNCNECIARRKFGWVNRCMAEKSISDHTLVLTLTYANDTSEEVAHATLFHYRDVQLMIKRLRKAFQGDKEAYVRFVVCGEQGTAKGRVHWHVILFSNRDILNVGTWEAYVGRFRMNVPPTHVMAEAGHSRRAWWSLWRWGHVNLMIPDNASIAYVVKYCIKDAFSQRKARGTERQHTMERVATGMFRVSKYPAIGWDYMDRKLVDMMAEGRTLPKPQLPVDGHAFAWHPTGASRVRLLEGLRAINDAYRAKHGKDTPQWSALKSFCEDDDKAMDILNGQKVEITEVEDDAREIAGKTSDNIGWYDKRQTARQCGSTVACNLCLRSRYHETGEAGPGIEAVHHEGGLITFREVGETDDFSLKRKQRDCANGGINPGCYQSGQPRQRAAFPASNQSARQS